MFDIIVLPLYPKTKQMVQITSTQVKNLKERGYTIHNKRVLGNPMHTSDETKVKDLAQEIALIVEWLRDKHGIWVYTECDVYGDGWYPKILPCSRKLWSNVSIREKIEEFTRYGNLFYNTPQEAYLIAIDFTFSLVEIKK